MITISHVYNGKGPIFVTYILIYLYLFGHVISNYTRLVELFRYLASKHGYTTLCYVNDIISISLPDKAWAGFYYLRNLLQELNFPISPSKVVAPNHEATCLDITMNTEKQTRSIPAGKQDKIIEKCKNVLKNKSVTKRVFQSLLGFLMFIHKCVKSSRAFTNRLLCCLSESTGHFISVINEIKQIYIGSSLLFLNSMVVLLMFKEIPHMSML